MTEAVLCGVDWHAGCREAVRVAERLSGALGARLILAHVAPTPLTPTVSIVPGGQAELAYTEGRDAAELLAEIASEEHLDEHVERRIAFGDPAEQLAALAADENAAFLVVASHGRGALRTILLGSVANSLAVRAPCPVVVVPRALTSSVSAGRVHNE
jgi:nucleotide-binding universal stress UspA family protein